MTYDTITIERRDEVLLLTLNRPEKLNAWTRYLPKGKASPPFGQHD